MASSSGRIFFLDDEGGDTSHCGHQLAQYFKPLWYQFAEEKNNAWFQMKPVPAYLK
jgi:hypothetical protein